MRPPILGCAILTSAALICGCSRNPPAPAPQSATAATVELKSASLRLATALEDPIAAQDAGAALENVAAPPLTGKTILHVGDSMVGGNWGLTRALDQRFSAEGARFIRDFKVSESIVSYDHSPKLKSLIDKHRPDIVIITLGTNDVFVPYPASMVGNVQNIVKRVGSRECYWMGPPTWKPDTGIVQVLKDSVAPCKFFDSSGLKLQRAGDGIHPTDRGGADWATSFWTYFRGTPAAPSPANLGDAGAL